MEEDNVPQATRVILENMFNKWKTGREL